MKGSALKIIILCHFAVLLICSCSDDIPVQPEAPVATIKLYLEYASSVDAYLRMIIDTVDTTRTYGLMRDNVLVQTIKLRDADTLIFEDSLQPDRTYVYRIVTPVQGEVCEQSNEVHVTTMGLTSNDFEIRTYIVGEFQTWFNDIAIINDTLAYAVGELWGLDSTGRRDWLCCNLAAWDGKTWSLQRAKVLYREDSTTVPLYGIMANSQSDIWLLSGVPFHGNCGSWIIFHLWEMGVLHQGDGGVLHGWGIPNDMYFVGENGSIVRYNHGIWTRLESPANKDIQDIWGAYDEKRNEQIILCAETKQFENSPRRLLRIYENGRIDTMLWGMNLELKTLWFQSLDRIFAGGGGLFTYRSDGKWHEENESPTEYATHIRGQAPNDVFVSYAYGTIGHFNGATWTTWKDDRAASWISCDYKNDLAIFVGYTNDALGIIKMMKRRK